MFLGFGVGERNMIDLGQWKSHFSRSFVRTQVVREADAGVGDLAKC